jgi:hypothetical protein
MPKGRLQTANSLIDAIRPSESDGALVAAVFATYGLSLDQPDFFGQDFLPTLFGLGGVRDRGYGSPVALERRLGEVDCTLICDAHAVAEGARPSLRVDVLPVGHKTQHAKLVLIHRKRLVRLLLTSANLTHEGYRRNREVAVVLDFKPDGSLPGEILELAVNRWQAVLGNAGSEPFRRSLAAAAEKARVWTREAKLPKGRSVEVVFGGGPTPLWRQVVNAWPQGEPVLEWHICSPFWPLVESNAGNTPFEAIAIGLSEKGASLSDCTLQIIAAADSPGEKTLPRFPFRLVQHLRQNNFPVRRGKIIPAQLAALQEEVPEGKSEEQRDLHAKWLILRGPQTAVALVGSANFTREGLGVLTQPERANIEACLLLRSMASVLNLQNWLPPLVSQGTVDWASCTLTDLREPPSDEQPSVKWPDFIFRIDVDIHWDHAPDPDGMLTIHLRNSTAPDFQIKSPLDADHARTCLICDRQTHAMNQPGISVGITADSVRAILTRRVVRVCWGSPPIEALFPVNIAETSKISLPSVLGAKPDEQQLLAYFHGKVSEDDLITLLEEQAKRTDSVRRSATPQEKDGQLRELQNYVVREFVESLYGLSDTLRQAAYSPRALEQAMLGDFSPSSLAEQVLQAFSAGRRSPTATAFQLVELFRVLDELTWPSDRNILPTDRMILDDVRRRTLERLLGFARAAAARSDFRNVCLDTEFDSYVAAVLSHDLANRWRETCRLNLVTSLPDGTAQDAP